MITIDGEPRYGSSLSTVNIEMPYRPRRSLAYTPALSIVLHDLEREMAPVGTLTPSQQPELSFRSPEAEADFIARIAARGLGRETATSLLAAEYLIGGALAAEFDAHRVPVITAEEWDRSSRLTAGSMPFWETIRVIDGADLRLVLAPYESRLKLYFDGDQWRQFA